MPLNKEFFQAHGISDDIANLIYAERGKEITDTNARIAALTAQNGDLQKQVADLTAEKANWQSKQLENQSNADNVNAELEKLKKQVADYEAEKANAAQMAEKAKAEQELEEAINQLVGDRKWSSDYAKAGVIADIKKEKQNTPTADISLLFKTVTDGKEGIFAGPTQKVILPSGNNTEKGEAADDAASARAIMGLAPLN